MWGFLPASADQRQMSSPSSLCSSSVTNHHPGGRTVQPSCSRKLVEPDQTARPTFKSTLVRRPSRVGPSQSIIWSHHNVHLVTLEWAIGATLLSIWSRHPRRRVGFLRVNSQDSSPLRMTSGAHPVESRSLLPAMTGAMSKANQSGI
jgi:hypothetical protein